MLKIFLKLNYTVHQSNC